MLRRAVAKKPKLKALAHRVLSKYTEHDYAGTNVSHVQQNLADVAPLPGQGQRQAWVPLFAPMGPIGLLLTQVHEKAAAIDHDFCLHVHGWPENH